MRREKEGERGSVVEEASKHWRFVSCETLPSMLLSIPVICVAKVWLSVVENV